MTKFRGYEFQGDLDRFDVVAEFVHDRYRDDIQYIADVAGGPGLLCRILNKKHNYECEVVDPRGWTMKGVDGQAENFDPSAATYYDLIIGMHPDEATRAVAEAARVRPTVLIPSGNFWSGETLEHDEVVKAIADYYREHGVNFERVVFEFEGPENIGLVSEPPTT